MAVTRARSDEFGALDRYAGPALLVWGEHDVTAVPAEAGPQMVAGHDERLWRSISGAGHWVQYEQHERISALLLAWFG